MIPINQTIIEQLREEQIEISPALLYMLAIEYGLDFSFIPQLVQDQVHRTGLVSRNYTQAGKPILTKNLFEIQQQDSLISDDFVTKVIGEWMALWPKPTETGLTYSVSGSLPQAIARMRSFINVNWTKHGLPKKTHDEKWAIIMTASRGYLAYQKSKRWSYTKKNVKFIGDLEGSVLAEWCLKVLDNKLPNSNTILDRMV